jgi:hypothetical protein
VKSGSNDGSDEDEDIMEQDDSDFEPSGEEQEDEEQGESDSEPRAKVVIMEQSAIFALLWSLFQIHHINPCFCHGIQRIKQKATTPKSVQRPAAQTLDDPSVSVADIVRFLHCTPEEGRTALDTSTMHQGDAVALLMADW